jgi:hypothetical protein
MTNKYHATKFIKISNNNNPAEFHIDITTMNDARLRISALKAQYNNYCNTGLYYKDVFSFFSKDWSFYVLERGKFENYEDIKIRRDELINLQNLKFIKKIEINN